MKNRKGKNQTDAPAAKPFSIEQYNSRTDRRTSQNGSLMFSAFVFVLAFLVATALGFLIAGDMNIWVLCIGFAVAVIAIFTVRIAAQWERIIILRFGSFNRVAGPGLIFMVPIVEQAACHVDLRTVTTPFGAEKTLTSDLVPVDIDAVLFWMVWDAEKACMEVENYYDAVSMAAQTALRDAIGQVEIAELSMQRAHIDHQLKKSIEEKTEQWGVTIIDVEIRDIVIPKELQRAMAQEAVAERKKNARMVLAEAEKDISEMFVEAAEVYDKNPKAMQLRAMNLAYEGAKDGKGILLAPSSLADGFDVSKLFKGE